MIPDVRYVKTPDGAHIAFQVFGEGKFDLVFVPGFASNLEAFWRLDPVERFVRRLGGFARVTLFDRRGTGLSDRIDESSIPTLEARMDDIRAVMDAAGVERAGLFGYEDGATLCAVFAASQPSRVFCAVLHGTSARGLGSPDFPWAWSTDAWDEYLSQVDDSWGTQPFVDFIIESAWPSRRGQTEFARELGSFLRVCASPGAALVFERFFRDMDIRDILGAIQVPVLVTHTVHDQTESIECARHLAAHIPGARLLELPGGDHYPFGEIQDQLLSAVEDFLVTSHDEQVDFDRVLATVLFTDIVGSTERSANIGDRAWRELVSAHNQRVRALLSRFRGREIDTAGDGFLAVFDGPARAVRCALAIGDALRSLDIEIRAGVHAGEVEFDSDAVRGIAVHIGARIAGLAAPGDVYVSSTVKDLVAGSGLQFEDRGEHELKGIPGTWHLSAARR